MCVFARARNAGKKKKKKKMKLLRSNRTAPSPVGDGPDDMPSILSPPDSPQPRSFGDAPLRATSLLKSSHKSTADKLAEDDNSDGE